MLKSIYNKVFGRIFMDEQKNKDRIMQVATDLFQEKGPKFTMDELASALKMSKKTLYVYFTDKEDLFHHAVDHIFDSITDAKSKIITDETIELRERIIETLQVLPRQYQHIDFRQLYMLKDKYPRVYEHLSKRLESNWETTIELLEKGQREHVLRDFSIPVFKTIYESTLEHFFERDVLKANHISYPDALREVVEIIMNGISE